MELDNNQNNIHKYIHNYTLITALMSIVPFCASFNNIAMVFIGANQKHTCQVPADRTENQTLIRFVAGIYINIYMYAN